jgi:hypothetical protein
MLPKTLFFFFCGTGVRTQGFMLVKQVLLLLDPLLQSLAKTLLTLFFIPIALTPGPGPHDFKLTLLSNLYQLSNLQ